ncbi:MAG: fluoride efflux transporter CrcB [Beijerinckiaceae bacterium]|nr:fluoride efflux transporter CrcB [Beijerinckiaceae bacterium]
MRTALLVFLGGGLGSVGRWLVGLAALRAFGPGFPAGTLAVNLAGGLVMGVLARLLVGLPSGGHDARIFLMTGILGGFTTFSAFSLDAVTLWNRGEAAMAMAYVAASVGGSIAALAAGLWLGGLLTR